MKWLKKWFYLFLLISVGILYLTCVDKWQVYAEPLREAKGWCGALWSGGAAATSGDVQGYGGALPGFSEDSEALRTSGDSSMAGTGLPEGAAEGMSSESGGAGMSVENGTSAGNGGTSEGDDSPAGNGGTSAEDGPPAGNGGTSAENASSAGDDTPAEAVYMTVEDSYFADALFIGDSRTVGLSEYSGLKEVATFYAATGLTVHKLFDAAIVSVPGERKKITVEEALQQNSFAKIYLMLGINEMGTGTVETFLKKYQEAVDHLRELQPDAVIYLQGIVKATAERSAKGDYINNEGIEARNEGISRMADDRSVFYLDVNPLLCDESGGIVPGYTFDGVHLKAKYLGIWENYLKTHAISP